MEKYTVTEAARILGVGNETVMAGLRTDKFPFGVAVKGKRNYTYIIPKARLDAWLEGKLDREERKI